jgi:SP family general alpha glucoside:H+ symporter-like MFS transporter
VNSFFGQAQFLSRFGIKVGTKLTIPANWQSGLTNAVTVGEIVGLVVTGIMQERLGSKVIFVAGMIAMIGAIFIAVFAQSLPMLLAAELVMGIPWGMFREWRVSIYDYSNVEDGPALNL